MSFKLKFTPEATEHLNDFNKIGDKAVLKKIKALLIEIVKDPYTGTGKPEQLKYNLSGYWSRRINKNHRLVYFVKQDELVILILSLNGHYGDK